VAKSGNGGFTRFGTKRGFPSEEDDGSFFRMNGHDLIVQFQCDGPGYTRSLVQMSGHDSNVGLDGPGYAARFDGSSFILAAPKSDGASHNTSAFAWKISKG